MTALLLSQSQDISIVNLIPRGGALARARSVGASTRLGARNDDIESADRSLYVSIGNLWYRVPQPLRYFVSGNMGNVCLYLMEKGMRAWMQNMTPPPKHVDSLAYFTAYILHIAAQHSFHAFLVYGLESINTQQKYWSTFLGTYQAYAVSAFGSTFLNSHLIKQGWNRDVAFFTTLWIFSCLNYLWIGYIVRKAREKATETEPVGPKQGGKFVRRRVQDKKLAPMRGGCFDTSQLDECLGGFMTIPSEASP